MDGIQIMDKIHYLFSQFMQERKFTGAAEATLRGYESSFALFDRVVSNVKLEEINRETIVEFFNKLKTRERSALEAKKDIGVKNTTLVTYKNKLGSFFNYLVKRKEIEANPFKDLKIAKPVEENRKYLLSEEIQKIFAAIDVNIAWKNNFVKKRNSAIIAIALFLGLRKGEILGLKLTDIYLEKKQLLVRGVTSKSKRNKIVPINQNAYVILLDYLDQRVKKKYFNEFLFVSENKDMRFTEHGLKHMIKKLEKAVGFRFHMHQFRHTLAVNLRHKGSDVMEIMDVLGHRDSRMTAEYLRGFPIENSRERLNALTLDTLM